jgi:hypothetical protein
LPLQIPSACVSLVAGSHKLVLSGERMEARAVANDGKSGCHQPHGFTASPCGDRAGGTGLRHSLSGVHACMRLVRQAAGSAAGA